MAPAAVAPIASIVVILEALILSIVVMQERVATPSISAGAAERHAAAEFSPGHAEHVTQYPKERRVAVDIDAVRLPIDFDGEGHGSDPMIEERKFACIGRSAFDGRLTRRFAAASFFRG